MSTTLDDLIGQASQAFEACHDSASLENTKVRFLGKQGAITAMMKGLAQLPPEQKREEGARINQAKQAIEAALTARRQALADAALAAQLAEQTIDVTLPGRGRGRGSVHPVIRT